MNSWAPENCPSCGAPFRDGWSYVGDSNGGVSVGKAALGAIIAGPVGAVLGGISGKKKYNFYCNHCGFSSQYDELPVNFYAIHKTGKSSGNYSNNNRKVEIDKSKSAVQSKYIIACSTYKNIMKYIDEMCAMAIGVIDPLYIKTCFDVVLQYLLIKVAMADGKVEGIELEFIKKITTHGSLVDLMSEKLDCNVTWDFFLNIPNDKIIQFNAVTEEIVSEYIDKMLMFCGIIDAKTPEVDYYNKVLVATSFIAIALADIDDDVDENEKKVFIDEFRKMLGWKWEEAKKRSLQIDKDKEKKPQDE